MAAVTVLMPVYNAMPYLSEAVNSIIGQTFDDFILLIIDDGSTDGTADYLQQLADPRIQIVHDLRRGVGAALNHGLALCRTEFLARMDADDISLPRRLEEQIAFLRRNPSVGVVGTQFSYMGANGRRTFSPSLPCEHASIAARLRKGRLGIIHGPTMFRVAVLRNLGNYKIHGYGQDPDILLRMSEISQVANLDRIHYLYRLHQDNVDLKRFLCIGDGIAYALHCATTRSAGQPEMRFEAFCRQQEARYLHRLLSVLDAYGLAQYRTALRDIAEFRHLRGYTRLCWSALCAPKRTWDRLIRRAGLFSAGG